VKLKSHGRRSTRERGRTYNKSLGESEKSWDMSEIFYCGKGGRKSTICEKITTLHQLVLLIRAA
jgi:hypothetical protein